MELTDSHTHLYLDAFRDDIHEVIQRAQSRKIKHFFLPNIDFESIEPMHALCREYPGTCYPMMGLHPCSVNKDFESQLAGIEKHLEEFNYTAIGETGMDLYHDKTFAEEQEASLVMHINWAKKFGLPIVLHTRNCNEKVLEVIKKHHSPALTGVFHCFNGSFQFASEVMEVGFHLGIGGVATFKNSGVGEVVKELPIESLLLETDAPYLAPHPYRGKRNESAYIYEIASKVATLKDISIEEVAEVTTRNAFSLFKNAGGGKH